MPKITLEEFETAYASRRKGRQTGGPVLQAVRGLGVGEAVAIAHRCKDRQKCYAVASARRWARIMGWTLRVCHLPDGKVAILRVT